MISHKGILLNERTEAKHKETPGLTSGETGAQIGNQPTKTSSSQTQRHIIPLMQFEEAIRPSTEVRRGVDSMYPPSIRPLVRPLRPTRILYSTLHVYTVHRSTELPQISVRFCHGMRN